LCPRPFFAFLSSFFFSFLSEYVETPLSPLFFKFRAFLFLPNLHYHIFPAEGPRPVYFTSLFFLDLNFRWYSQSFSYPLLALQVPLSIHFLFRPPPDKCYPLPCLPHLRALVSNELLSAPSHLNLPDLSETRGAKDPSLQTSFSNNLAEKSPRNPPHLTSTSLPPFPL